MPSPDFHTVSFSGGLVEIHSSVKPVDTSYFSGNTDGYSWSNQKILYCQINNVWMDTVSALSGCHLVPFLQPRDEAALEDGFPEVLPDWKEEFSL